VWSRARTQVEDELELVRRDWEAAWGQPSRGNPLFENVPAEQHVADQLTRKFIRQGFVDPPPVVQADDDPLTRAFARITAAGGDPFADPEFLALAEAADG